MDRVPVRRTMALCHSPNWARSQQSAAQSADPDKCCLDVRCKSQQHSGVFSGWCGPRQLTRASLARQSRFPGGPSSWIGVAAQSALASLRPERTRASCALGSGAYPWTARRGSYTRVSATRMVGLDRRDVPLKLLRHGDRSTIDFSGAEPPQPSEREHA
jgi:hypothetical protein